MTEQRRTDFVTQRELFDALTALAKEEREDRHDVRNSLATALASLDTNMDTRLRGVETGLARIETRVDPEIRLRSLEASRDEQRGAMAALRILVAISGLISTAVGVVEALRIWHP